MSKDKIVEYEHLIKEVSRLVLDMVFERKNEAESDSESKANVDAALDLAVVSLISVMKAVEILLRMD